MMDSSFYLLLLSLAVLVYPSEIPEVGTLIIRTNSNVSTGQDFTVRPIRHSLPDGLQSVSGSSSDGGCISRNGSICNLQGGGTSVLFDNTILPLSGIEGDQWARDLFTVRRSGTDDIVIGFDFGTPVQLGRVELVLFNCPLRSISVREIQIWGRPSSDPFPLSDPAASGSVLFGSRIVSIATANSCEDLYRVCVQITSGGQSQVYYIVIPNAVESDWVYLAETIFHQFGVSVPCNPDTLVTEPVTPPEAIATTPMVTTSTGTHTTTELTDSTLMQTETSPAPVTEPSTTTQSGCPGAQTNTNTVAVVTAIIAVLLTAIIVVAIHIPLYVCYKNLLRSANDRATASRAEDTTYEQIDETRLGAGFKLELKENEAYGTSRVIG